jgi:hypothetical protein
MAIKIGNKIVQADGGGYQPQGVRDTPSQQQQNVYKQAFDTMKKAGITGVGDTNKDRRDLAEQMYQSAVIQNDPSANTDYNVITESSPLPKKEKEKVPLIDQFDQFMTSFGSKKIPSLPFSPLGFGIEALKGMNSTDQFFKNLNKLQYDEEGTFELDKLDEYGDPLRAVKNPLSNRDKITLINLVQRGGEGGGLQYLKNWAEDNDLSEEETMDLANKFTGEYSNIGSSISDSGIIDYLTEGGKPEGFKDSVAAMFGQYDSGKIPGRVIGDKLDEYGDPLIEDVMVDRPNLQTVTDNLGTVGLEYLKATNPAAFYALRPAATSGQIEELARTALTGNKDFDNQIFAAREQAARNKESQDRASGIMTASSAPPAPPPVVPPVVPPAEDEVPENPILNPIMSQRDPFDLAKFYASLPQYTQQGVMSPSLMQYYRNLGLFPRA